MTRAGGCPLNQEGEAEGTRAFSRLGHSPGSLFALQGGSPGWLERWLSAETLLHQLVLRVRNVVIRSGVECEHSIKATRGDGLSRVEGTGGHALWEHQKQKRIPNLGENAPTVLSPSYL